MHRTRSYQFDCPIARALDRIGDRWTLLILRDLQAGPARFLELQRGLTGIATNLLTDRLNRLMADGLAEQRRGGHGITVYDLTERGRQTSDLLYELAQFGGRFTPQAETVSPGNLRCAATTLAIAAKRVATFSMDFDAALILRDESGSGGKSGDDGEVIGLSVHNGDVSVTYGGMPDADVTLTATYAALLAVSEGRLPPDEFHRDHCEVTSDSPFKAQELAELITNIAALSGR